MRWIPKGFSQLVEKGSLQIKGSVFQAALDFTPRELEHKLVQDEIMKDISHQILHSDTVPGIALQIIFSCYLYFLRMYSPHIVKQQVTITLKQDVIKHVIR